MKILFALIAVLLALASNAQTPNCRKFRTGTFYYPQVPGTLCIRDKKFQREVFEKEKMAVTWKVKWTGECSFELLFESAENNDGVFQKGDRISTTITAVAGECYTFTATFHRGQETQVMPPGQMCRKMD